MLKTARYLKTSGFTLVEITVVMAILVILFGLATPYLLGTKEKFILESERERIINSLKDAQQKAIVAYQGFDYQIAFHPPQSYTRLPEDHTFILNNKIKIENAVPLTITFGRLTGNPDAPLSLTLVSPKYQCLIKVSSEGVITGSPPEKR
jgi:prepilin-type N-terminal cleavage/methylation domain-containing protein